MGTGKEQKITITASSNLSEDEINKAVKEAEQFTKEDKEKREIVDARNNLDGMIFNIEKSVKDNADKLSEADKTTLNTAVEEAKRSTWLAKTKKNSTRQLKTWRNLHKAFSPRCINKRKPKLTNAGAGAQTNNGENKDGDPEIIVEDDKK